MMPAKPRTWPFAVCVDPADAKLWNVQGLDAVAIFTPGVEQRIAKQAFRGLTAAFDWARDLGPARLKEASR